MLSPVPLSTCECAACKYWGVYTFVCTLWAVVAVSMCMCRFAMPMNKSIKNCLFYTTRYFYTKLLLLLLFLWVLLFLPPSLSWKKELLFGSLWLHMGRIHRVYVYLFLGWGGYLLTLNGLDGYDSVHFPHRWFSKNMRHATLYWCGTREYCKYYKQNGKILNHTASMRICEFSSFFYCIRIYGSQYSAVYVCVTIASLCTNIDKYSVKCGHKEKRLLRGELAVISSTILFLTLFLGHSRIKNHILRCLIFLNWIAY